MLISLALCVFRAGLRGALQKPRLLLLDEIDAPLHPSMARTLIDIVSNTIVGDHGIQVLMTTHSPSTVAMAPDESIYAMEPGKPGLYKVGKRQAISLLTSAIPTLSIAFDGRRQVLVESVRDAGRYEALYLQVAARLKPDRSLTFIGVGRKPESGADENAGCAKVKEMVGSLSGGGNESVLGLIDWDTTNAPSDRIFVLAHGVRYSIENVLLDPLLVAAAAVRKKRDEGVGLGFTQEEAFGALASMNEQRLQAVADAVQRLVLNVGNGDALPNLVDCQYQGGRNVKVSRDYLQMKGHKLQERVVEALPCLRAFHKEDELLMHIADSILVDLPGLCPVEIEAAFARMLEWRPT